MRPSVACSSRSRQPSRTPIPLLVRMLAQAGVHRADQLVGLVDPAAQLLGDAAEHEPGEHGPLPFAQRSPAGFDPGRERPGRPGQGVLVTRAGDLDQEHVVFDGVPHIELTGDLAVEFPERIENRGLGRGLARRHDGRQHRLRGRPDVTDLLGVNDPG